MSGGISPHTSFLVYIIIALLQVINRTVILVTKSRGEHLRAIFAFLLVFVLVLLLVAGDHDVISNHTTMMIAIRMLSSSLVF
jgi:hypothetical protein